MTKDTIFALASGAGLAGVAVIRISGPAVRQSLDAMCGGVPPDHRAVLRQISDSVSGELLDIGLVMFFAGPGSFTGEDCAELQVHGGPAVIRSVLDCLSALPGLRPAAAGEFSRRAFAKGKMDLLMAEGLADLVEAETAAQQQQALFHLRGLSSDVVGRWRTAITEAIALAEAAIDFVEEEEVVGEAMAGIRPVVVGLRDDLHRHLRDARKGEVVRDGVRVTIAGAPNVGKSSLLNRLAGREAAIVTELPGTTRDVIEVRLDIEGLVVTFSDTAGLREGLVDRVEAIGMERSRMAMVASDLVLWLSAPEIDDPGVPPDFDSQALRVQNKVDLIAGSKSSCGELGGEYRVSAHSGEGIDQLLTAIHERLSAVYSLKEPAVVVRERHRYALAETIGDLDAVLEGENEPIEGIAENLRLAARALGTLTGQVGVEDILDSIFSRFCIGK